MPACGKSAALREARIEIMRTVPGVVTAALVGSAALSPAVVCGASWLNNGPLSQVAGGQLQPNQLGFRVVAAKPVKLR